MFPLPHPVRCPECNASYWPGEPHECDVDSKFIHQQEKQRRAELAAAVAELDEELSHPEKVAATLEAWSENATLPPLPEDAPDREHADVSLPALRAFAEWQREHEDEG